MQGDQRYLNSKSSPERLYCTYRVTLRFALALLDSTTGQGPVATATVSEYHILLIIEH